MFGGSSGSLPTVMKHDFSMVPKAEIPRSSFDRSHGYKTTFSSGYLVPFFVDEALPGDTFNVKATTFARMATPIVPIMDNLYCDTFFFAVPLRILWDNFKKFMGEQNNPGDSTSYLIPQVDPGAGGWADFSLADYFGIPTYVTASGGGANTNKHSAMWHRAYNKIWNAWFRDENLQNSVAENQGDGPDSASDYVLLKRGKRHDYFTSCLPWPQKGTAVSIPLGTSAPVLSKNETIKVKNGWAGSERTLLMANVTGANIMSYGGADAGGVEARWGTTTGLYTDLNTATAATINSLRQAFQIQKLYERDARGGTRYTEIVRSHFGVTSPDARLQRPEYLGGGSAPIRITPVPQTSVTAGTPQGNLAAFGTFSHSNNGFVKSFTEHSVIIGLVNVRADLNYQKGLDRMFSRRTKYDFYWPALSHLGEQGVLNKEIFYQGTPADDAVFGYQEMYAEYRYKPSKVTGLFKSHCVGTIDIWHLAQKFVSLPTLDAGFIQDAPPVSRVIAVPSQPEFLFDAYIQCKCARPMPVYSVPGMIDHF